MRVQPRLVRNSAWRRAPRTCTHRIVQNEHAHFQCSVVLLTLAPGAATPPSVGTPDRVAVVTREAAACTWICGPVAVLCQCARAHGEY
jgi:hypothetical protein